MSTKRNGRADQHAAPAPETTHTPGEQIKEALTSGRIFRPAEELPPVFVWELYELGRRMVADFMPEQWPDRASLIPPSYSRPDDAPIEQHLQDAEEFDSASLVRRVAELGKIRREYLLTCLLALERDAGCTTPAEAFISQALFLYQEKILTPKSIVSSIESEDGFLRNYRDMTDEVALFIENNPHKAKELIASLHPPGTPQAPEAA